MAFPKRKMHCYTVPLEHAAADDQIAQLFPEAGALVIRVEVVKSCLKPRGLVTKAMKAKNFAWPYRGGLGLFVEPG